jgi:23S rRNA pseudouridine1911/1915/1917 synthase
MIELDVLYEDNHCVAVNKPAGLLSQGDRSGEPSVVDVVSHYLKTRYAKPGNVYVGLLHRLDRPVSGVMLLAKTSKAAARLSQQIRAGTISKVYWAIVAVAPTAESGVWTDVLTKDEKANRSQARAVGDRGAARLESPSRVSGEAAGIRATGGADGREASVEYRVLERSALRAKLELLPRSGRSHQLRVQLASRGHPILGDIKYGSNVRLKATDGRLRVALHARQITFEHPTRREAMTIVAPVMPDWPESRES